MTHEEVMEQVRENIISLVSAAIYTSFDFPKGMTWAELAKEIISIPEILIKDPDQSLPTIVPDALSEKAQYQMKFKENWVKVIPEEGK